MKSEELVEAIQLLLLDTKLEGWFSKECTRHSFRILSNQTLIIKLNDSITTKMSDIPHATSMQVRACLIRHDDLPIWLERFKLKVLPILLL